MPEALVPGNEAIERVLDFLRNKLEMAVKNGQRIRIDASDGVGSQRMPLDTPLSELIRAAQDNGSLHLHIYIGPKGHG